VGYLHTTRTLHDEKKQGQKKDCDPAGLRKKKGSRSSSCRLNASALDTDVGITYYKYTGNKLMATNGRNRTWWPANRIGARQQPGLSFSDDREHQRMI